jgi:hypothetical protein
LFFPAKKGTSLGIIYHQAKMLLDARSRLPMNRLLMIGRLCLFLHPAELQAVRKVSPPGALANYKWGDYADLFFTQCLGVSEVSTLDYSSYEGANILHDLSQPIPSDLMGRFDLVVEGGTLEHVFNFPMAITNLMQMTAVGGSVFALAVANNLCGHGFYQFSPEIIFRVFTAENGFKLGKVLALCARYPGVELVPIREVFEVADPALVGRRVGMVTGRPIVLCFEARRTADLPIFATSPMQSDYSAAWVGQTRSPSVPRWIRNLSFYPALRTWLFETSRFQSLRHWLVGQLQRREHSLHNKRLYKKVQVQQE